jgi:hypothetical protein
MNRIPKLLSLATVVVLILLAIRLSYPIWHSVLQNLTAQHPTGNTETGPVKVKTGPVSGPVADSRPNLIERYSQGSDLGIQCHVANTSSQPLRATYHFRSGDRFKLECRPNQPSYIYIIDRTLIGSATEHPEPSRADKGCSYKLLDPLGSKGVMIPANQMIGLPRDGYFRMDNLPGEEEVSVVLSRNPVDLSRYFNSETGICLSTPDNVAGVGPLLSRELSIWHANAVSAAPPEESPEITAKVDLESIAIARNSNEPMLFVLGLRHL